MLILDPICNPPPKPKRVAQLTTLVGDIDPKNHLSDSRIRPHGIGNKESYSFPNPTTEKATNAAWKARYCVDKLTKDDGYLLADVFEAYFDLLTHPWGTGGSIKKIRELRRCLLNMLKEEDGEQND